MQKLSMTPDVNEMMRDAETTSRTEDPRQPTITPRRRTLSIRFLLVVYVLLMVVPAWTFAAYVAWQYAVSQRLMVENAGRTAALTAASSIDYRLTSIESALAALALSPALRNGDMAAFYQEATALGRTKRAVVALVTATGEQIFNTNLPFGQVLPPTNLQSRYDEAIKTRRTQFSPAFFGKISNRWLVTIAVPVVRGPVEPIEHVLILGIDTMLQWGEVLASIDMPPTWAAAVVDASNVITARKPDPLRYVGTSILPDVTTIIAKGNRGHGLGTAADGSPVHVFFDKPSRAPWKVLVGVPRTEADGALRDAMIPVALSGLALLLASLLAAWLFGRRFTQQLVNVAGAATAFRGGTEAEPGEPTSIKELVELRRTLEIASSERNEFEERLRDLIADKELLMQEVHHRVKNSLQLVRGVLSLQARGEEDPKAKAALSAAAARILTVADVHQHLYQGHSTAEVHVGRYLEDLVRDLARSMIGAESARRIVVHAPDAIWPSEKLTALGLIMTELVTNSVKYGAGVVQIRLSIAPDGAATLVVEDQGQGFPEGFELGQGSGLGSKLITSLVRPQDGSITIDRNVPYGRVVVQFNASWRSGEESA